MGEGGKPLPHASANWAHVSFVSVKTTPPGAVFQCFPPVFASFLQNEPNPHFFLTYSFHNTSTLSSWVRLVKTLFYIK